MQILSLGLSLGQYMRYWCTIAIVLGFVTFVPTSVFATAPGSYSTCSAVFTDHAGSSNYSNNRNDTYTYCPSAGGEIVATFNSFDLEPHASCNYDVLHIYDGNNTTNLIGSYCGTNSPGTITSTASDGCLTFRFISDGSEVYAGWQAGIHVARPIIPCDACGNGEIDFITTIPPSCQELNHTISDLQWNQFWHRPRPALTNNDLVISVTNGNDWFNNERIEDTEDPGGVFSVQVADPNADLSLLVQFPNLVDDIYSCSPVTITVPGYVLGTNISDLDWYQEDPVLARVYDMNGGSCGNLIATITNPSGSLGETSDFVSSGEGVCVEYTRDLSAYTADDLIGNYRPGSYGSPGSYCYSNFCYRGMGVRFSDASVPRALYAGYNENYSTTPVDTPIEECDDGKHCANGTACAIDAECTGIGDGLCTVRSGDGCSSICEWEAICIDNIYGTSYYSLVPTDPVTFQGVGNHIYCSDASSPIVTPIGTGWVWGCADTLNCGTIDYCGDNKITPNAIFQDGVAYCWQDEYWTTGVPSMPKCSSSDDCGGEHCIYPCFDASGNDYRGEACAISNVSSVLTAHVVNLPVGYTGSAAISICHTALGNPSYCGIQYNGAAEECDDGNTSNGDGCSSICEIEPICGDGVQASGEACDDGNTFSGDGCSATCTLENCTYGSGSAGGILEKIDYLGFGKKTDIGDINGDGVDDVILGFVGNATSNPPFTLALMVFKAVSPWVKDVLQIDDNNFDLLITDNTWLGGTIATMLDIYDAGQPIIGLSAYYDASSGTHGSAWVIYEYTTRTCQ